MDADQYTELIKGGGAESRECLIGDPQDPESALAFSTAFQRIAEEKAMNPNLT
jgi:hypothetical protein